MFRLLNIIILIFLTFSICYGSDTDSLESVISNTASKRRKVDLLNQLSVEFGFNNPEKYISSARKALEISKSIEYEKGIAMAHLHLGDIFNQQFKIDSALNHYNMALSVYRELTDDEKTGETLYRIGTIFFMTSDYKAALHYTNESLNIFQIVGDKTKLANVHSLLCEIQSYMGFKETAIEHCRIALDLYDELNLIEGRANLLNSIGNIYLDLGQYEKSEQYFNEAIYIAKSNDDSFTISTSLSNLGHLKLREGKNKEAIKFFKRALEIDQQQNDGEGLGYSYYNMGEAYFPEGDFKRSRFYLQKSLEYAEKSVDLELQAKVYSEIGNLYSETGNYRDAISNLKKSLTIAQKIDADPILQTCYNNLAKYYDKLGDNENALNYFKLYMLHKEKMYANQSSTKIAEAEALYDLGKKEKQIQLLRSENRIKDLEASERNLMNIWLISGLVFVLALSAVVYRQYRIQNKANKTLQAQKAAINRQKEEIAKQRDNIEQTNHTLEDINKQLTDSIQYARRIQMSLLPDNRLLKANFSDSFILYLPRDIVSGDFYWLGQRDSLLYMAIIDCTGHGVPGAFMTVLANSLLNQIVIEEHCIKPDLILNRLDEKVKKSLNQHGITLSAFEGMDIAFLTIDINNYLLKFAGAKMPLYYIRENQLEQISGERFSIGGNEVENKQFSLKSIQLKKGDIIYLASDGFQDQFGGTEEKKFMKLHFKNLLSSMHDLTLIKQKEKLVTTLNEWKGFHTQTDDVLVVGIRI